MNLNILQNFRHEIYSCFERAADALFNTADAHLPETDAHSFPELSLSPCFERLTMDEINERYRALKQLTHFEDLG